MPRNFRMLAAMLAAAFALAATGTAGAGGPPSGGDGGNGGAGGCTPGFFKNRGADLVPDATIGQTFGLASSFVYAGTTLAEALEFGGGSDLEGAYQILLRAATAAFLNAENIEDFGMTTDEVIDAVQDAIASGDREEIIALAEELDALNNQGDCPLD